MANKYFVGDDRIFKMVFKDDTGTEQTPASCTVTIKSTSGATIVEDVAGVINGNECQYTYTDLVEGQYVLYFSAVIGSETVTDTINYRVIRKDGVAK